MNQSKTVWVFHGRRARFAGGIFSTVPDAERWMAQHSLSGVLTEYPVDVGVYDWALRCGAVGMTGRKLEERSQDPDWIGGFTCASQDHLHFEDGKRV